MKKFELYFREIKLADFCKERQNIVNKENAEIYFNTSLRDLSETISSFNFVKDTEIKNKSIIIISEISLDSFKKELKPILFRFNSELILVDIKESPV